MKNEIKHKIEILKETAKAVYVECDGVKGWLPKAWVKNGEISEKVFAGLKEKAAEYEAEKQADREWKNGFHSMFIARETEKAVAIVAVVDRLDGETFEKMVWIPKSVCREGKVPGWILDKRAEEVCNEVRGKGRFDGFKFSEA